MFVSPRNLPPRYRSKEGASFRRRPTLPRDTRAGRRLQHFGLKLAFASASYRATQTRASEEETKESSNTRSRYVARSSRRREDNSKTPTIGSATERLRILPLIGIDKISNHLVANPISSTELVKLQVLVVDERKRKQRDIVCDGGKISWREGRAGGEDEGQRVEEGGGETEDEEDGEGDDDGNDDDGNGDGGGCILHRLYILFAHVNILGWFCSPLELKHIQINDITRTYACLLST